MEKKIKISVLIPSRRTEFAKKFILQGFGITKDPSSVEMLFRIDDDKHDFIRMLKTDEELKQYNVKGFVGPRMGFWYLDRMFYYLLEKAQSEIIIPTADDSPFVLEEWDSKIIDIVENSDKPVAVGKVGKITAFSTKDLFRECWPHARNKAADVHAVKKAWWQKRLIFLHPLASTSKLVDEVRKDGRYHGWAADPKIIENTDNLIIRDIDDFTLEELLDEDPNKKYRTIEKPKEKPKKKPSKKLTKRLKRIKRLKTNRRNAIRKVKRKNGRNNKR